MCHARRSMRSLLYVLLVPNIYVHAGDGVQRLREDFEHIRTAVYDPSWTPKPIDWDWRASFEREWLLEQQTIMKARKLITPPHLRKFKYFSPMYYKPDMKQSNIAKFTEEQTLVSKYPTYPTLPSGYSHVYTRFQDILGTNPYSWSNETMDYAINQEKYDQLYLLQQKELAGNKNKTVLKHLYREWLKIDPLRDTIRRQKRNVKNDDLETEEKQMFAEYEQFHKDVADYYSGKHKNSTRGVVVKEERCKRDVKNDDLETEEKQMFAEYGQFHKDVADYYSGKHKNSTKGVVIKEERCKRDVKNDDLETEEKQMFAEYEQFHKDVADYYSGKHKNSTKGVVIKEERCKRDVKKSEKDIGKSLEHRKHSTHIYKNTIHSENDVDMYAEYEAFKKEADKHMGINSKDKRMNEHDEEDCQEKAKQNKIEDKIKYNSQNVEIFDDLGTLETHEEGVLDWNNTILDDLGSNWEGTTSGLKIDYKARRDEINRNTKFVDFKKLSWKEINEKYGLPLYATDSPPLNESLTKQVDGEKYFQMYDVLFPGKIRFLENVSHAAMFTDAPGDTPLPQHKQKTVPYDMYDDFYNVMVKERFQKQFTFGHFHYVPRNTETETTIQMRQVENDEYFKWYDEQFARGHKNLDQLTPHPMFADDVGTPCPDSKTKFIDPEKFDEEYDVVFGHRKKYIDVTPNKEWNALEEHDARTTAPWWTFCNSAYDDIQPRHTLKGIDTQEMIEKAVNLPTDDPEPGISAEEQEFEKELEHIANNVKKANPHLHFSEEDTMNGLKAHGNLTEKRRIKRHLDMLKLLIVNDKCEAKGGQLGGLETKGMDSQANSFHSDKQLLQKETKNNSSCAHINFNLKNVFGTPKPQRNHRIVRREERTSMHLFEYLKWAGARRKRRHTTPRKAYRPIFFDTNDSYIIFKNYMDRVTNGDISDFQMENEIYGDYIDRYLTAQFDQFKRMYTRYSTPFTRPTWTRRTGYTDSFGRKFTFDPNYTYTTPWEEIDVIQYISACRAMRKTTTIPTPSNFFPFTGTGTYLPRSKMTEYLDPIWLVRFGLLTTLNGTTEITTSMYLNNWLKYKEKQKEKSTTSISNYLRNFLQGQNKTRPKLILSTKLNKLKKYWTTQKTTSLQSKKKTTSLFYKNFFLRQINVSKYVTRRIHTNVRFNLSVDRSHLKHTTNNTRCKHTHYVKANITNSSTFFPEFLYHTSGMIKNFIEKYGSLAKEHMEKGFLRRRFLNENAINYCFQDQIKNLSHHIRKVDEKIEEKEQETEWYDDSIETTPWYTLNKQKEKKEKSDKFKEIIREIQDGTIRQFSDSNKTNRRKRDLYIKAVPSDSDSIKTTKKESFHFNKFQFYKKKRTEYPLKESNFTKTTSIFMKNFMARINLTSPKRRRFKITKRTSVPCRIVNLTTNYFPWDFFENRTIPHLIMHYYTGHENYTLPPIWSFTERGQNVTWSIELEEDPFFRLHRRFMGKTKRRLSFTHKPERGTKKSPREMFDEWRGAPLKPGLPSDMLSVQSKQLEEHVAFLSTMHYAKEYTEKLTVLDKLWKDESYSDYQKYQRIKLRTRHSMDFEAVVKYRLYKADFLRRHPHSLATDDSDYIFEEVQKVRDDNGRLRTFTFPMGNFKTLYPKYNPYYYNRSCINTSLMVENLRSLTKNPTCTWDQFEQAYRKNLTERMQIYLKENPDKKEDELDYEDFQETDEVIQQMYNMGLTTMLSEDLPHKNIDYIRNDYTAIDHAVFHWSIIGKKESRVNTQPYKPGQSSTTSLLDYYWKTPSTLDWQRYWKYPYTTTTTTTTTKPTGPDIAANKEYAKNLEKNLDPEARAKILEDLEQLGKIMEATDSSTLRTIQWHTTEAKYQNIKLYDDKPSDYGITSTVKTTEKTINIDDIIDPNDISRELRKRRKRYIKDDQTDNSDDQLLHITAKPIKWKIPDSVIEAIRGKTPPDDKHNTEIAFKYLQNSTDSEEYLKITLPNYMKDLYYRFTKYVTSSTPSIRWTIPKNVINMIDKGTNPIKLQAEKHIPFSIFRRKIMHIINLKMKSYSIPFFRQRWDKTPFSLNTEEKDDIYYDSLEKHAIRNRATHNYRMVTYMFPLFSNSCERIIKDMAEGYHQVYDPPGAKRIFFSNQTRTMKPGDYDGDWVKLNPSDLLRFPRPTVYWPTINRNDVTYRPPWIKNSTRTPRKPKTTTPFDTESFDSKDSMVRDDWVFTTMHWNDINHINITAMQIFMDRPPGQSSEFNEYCRKHGLPLDENGNPPTDWYDSQVPSDAEAVWNEVKEHDTFAPFSYSDERLGTVEEYVHKKDVKKYVDHLLNNQTINWAEEDFNETSTLVIRSKAYLSKRFSRERHYKYDAKYLKTLKEMNAPKKMPPGYKDAEYKAIEKIYESNKNNKSNIFLSNVYKMGIKPGHEHLRSEEDDINQPLSWEYNPNYTALVESDTQDPFDNPFQRPEATTTSDPYTFVDLSGLLKGSEEDSERTSTLADVPLEFIDAMVAARKNENPRVQTDSSVFPATTINAYTCEYVKDLMSSHELRKKNIPKDAIVAHPYGKPQPYYKKVIYDRLGRFIATTFVPLEQ